MIRKYIDIIKNQSEDVFGIKAKKTLSIYSVFSVASVVVPIVIVFFLLISKFF